MRYYDLQIINPKTGKTVRRWTTHPNGTAAAPDPGALQIEFDIIVADFATPVGGWPVKLFGIAQQDISQASNFNGMVIALYGGMGKGLPLANPAQNGLLVQGSVYQSFGNAIGNDRTLDFVVTPLTTLPNGIVFDWKGGTPLSQAIATSLSRSFPSYKQNIQISPKLVLAHDEHHYALTMTEFAAMLESITVGMVGGTTYKGVRVTVKQDTFNVFDGTTAKNPVQLTVADLIGQPTWYEPAAVSITAVMRADLQVGDYIKLPAGFIGAPGSVTVSQGAQTQAANKLAFQGSFLVTEMRHVGSLRDPSAMAWVTVMNCTFNAAGTPS